MASKNNFRETGFSDYIKKLLELLFDEVTAEPKLALFDGLPVPDFILRKGELIVISEVKFYRSRTVPFSMLSRAAEKLRFAGNLTGFNVILIVSSLVNAFEKKRLSEMGVVVWDRSNIANFLAALGREDILEELGQSLMAAQQGTDISLPYEDVDPMTDTNPLSYFVIQSQTEIPPIEKVGAKCISELKAIPLGRDGWATYERKCIQILQYLFEDDLSIWDKQSRTDDGLSRFDLVCRIRSADDFWRTLVESFSSRYVLFEMKNYSDPIPAGQIYTTERYLYPKALRGTAIIVTRNGAESGAITATKGALRENGKLILIINQEDLEIMLTKKDAGDSPNDHLSNKLDDHLISLSR
ncbi:hypothetical protein [Chitinophaga sp. GbtcB8]|uniref:hypothetical protein n=1 Tax=Chitinophaga sp. GbtcB8 TaxID=2824753 RepID=UPI001C3098E4|nr:hypothetical protein [Chitinophaga sp. GbtcB8]